MTEPMLSDELSYTLLKELEQNPNLSQRELAKKVGISLGKVNHCLKELIKAGFVKVSNFTKPGTKTVYVYLLTPQGLEEKAEVASRSLATKQLLYEKLKDEIEHLKQEILSDGE